MANPKDGNGHHTNGHRNWLDRRSFGKILVAGVGGLALAPYARGAEVCDPDRYEAWPSPHPTLYGKTGVFTGTHNVDVVIVGAGLSGLVAARELKEANPNITVLVLEGGARIGGRMYGRETKEVAGGLRGYTDYGGQWVGPTQYHMQELVDELGIVHFDSYEEGRSIQSVDGGKTKTAFNGDVSSLLLGCTPPAPSQYPWLPRGKCSEAHSNLPDCVHNDTNGAVWKALLEISKKVSRDRPWDTPEYDKQTFGAWIVNQPLKNNYSEWLSALQSHIGGSGGFEPDAVSLLHMAWTQKVGPQSETPEKWLLLKGAGQIPGRVAEKFIENDDPGNPHWRIVLNAPVTEIKQSQKGGRVTLVVGTLTVNADAVIVAIPPSLRAKIKFSLEPALPPEYVQFSNASRMGSMAKVHAVYDRAFWRDECLSGSFAGKLDPANFPKMCEFIADCSPPGGRPGILTGFIAANRNCQLGDLGTDSEKSRDLVLPDFVHFFGEKAGKNYLRDWLYYDWNDKPGSYGAFTTHLGPSIWTTSGKIGWRTPVNGRIFWAGTETSDEWPGYFDRAVKAGQVAAAAAYESLP